MTENEKHVLVTGASSGIGWASVKVLDAAGYRCNSPKPRYLVAAPASAFVTRDLPWFPDRLRDWLILRVLGT